AEDGIRDPLVTGVQTCALPISASLIPFLSMARFAASRTRRSCQGDFAFHCSGNSTHQVALGMTWASRSLGSALIVAASTPTMRRSEERRVGQERRARGDQHQDR